MLVTFNFLSTFGNEICHFNEQPGFYQKNNNDLHYNWEFLSLLRNNQETPAPVSIYSYFFNPRHGKLQANVK